MKSRNSDINYTSITKIPQVDEIYRNIKAIPEQVCPPGPAEPDGPISGTAVKTNGTLRATGSIVGAVPPGIAKPRWVISASTVLLMVDFEPV
jgi:hypothetical protein